MISWYECSTNSTIQLIAYVNEKNSESQSNSSHYQSQSQQMGRIGKIQKKVDQQRTNGINLMVNQSYEVIHQNMLNIRNMLNSQIYIQDLVKQNETFNVFNLNQQKIQIGQWIDARDGNEKWREAIILQKQDKRLLVHFIGKSSKFDEWIDQRSSRIAIFKSHTYSSSHSQYLSPFPENSESQEHDQSQSFNLNNANKRLHQITLETAHTLNQLSNQLFKLNKNQEQQQLQQDNQNIIKLNDNQQIQESNKHIANDINITKCLNQERRNYVISENMSQMDNDDISVNSLKSAEKQFTNDNECNESISIQSHISNKKLTSQQKLKYLQEYEIDTVNSTQLQNYLLASQLAPLLDRTGRALVDLSNHYALFGSNLQNTLPQLSNFHNTSNMSIITNEGSNDMSSSGKVNKMNQILQQHQVIQPLKHYYFQVPILQTPQEMHKYTNHNNSQINRLQDQQNGIDLVVHSQLNQQLDQNVISNPYFVGRKEKKNNSIRLSQPIHQQEDINSQQSSVQDDNSRTRQTIKKFDEQNECFSTKSDIKKQINNGNIKQSDNEGKSEIYINKHVTFNQQNIGQKQQRFNYSQQFKKVKKVNTLFMSKLGRDDRDSSTNRSIHSESEHMHNYSYLPKNKIKINTPGIDKIQDDFENDDNSSDQDKQKGKSRNQMWEDIIEETNDHFKKEDD